MSGDFMWGYVPAARITPPRTKFLRDLLKSTSVNDLDENSYSEDDPDPVGSLKAAMQWYKVAMHCTETSVVQFPGMKYSIYLSGGMSWGDIPTEACGHMFRIDGHRDLWKILEKWSKEDVKEETSSKKGKKDGR